MIEEVSEEEKEKVREIKRIVKEIGGGQAEYKELMNTLILFIKMYR